MGNCIGHREQTESKGLFDAKEIDLLRNSFSAYFERIPEARKQQAFTVNCFEEIFIENPRFG